MSWKTAWLSVIVVLMPVLAAAYDDISIDASLDDSTKTIHGAVEIRFVDYARGANRYLFRLYPNATCKASDTACGMTVDSARIDGTDATSSLSQKGMYANLLCPASWQRRDTTVVRLLFSLNMRKPRIRTGYEKGQYLLEAWFPMPALWRDSSWVQTVYAEQSEPTADLFDITSTIRIPDSLQYIAPASTTIDSSNGTRTWQTQMDGVDDIGAVIGTGFTLDSSTVGGTKLDVWSRTGDHWVVPSVEDAVAKTLSFMSGEGLPYPWREQVIVIGGLTGGGGLELPHMTAIMPPFKPEISHSYEATVIHEMIHQWFYGLINNDQADEPMLDESITEYFTHRITTAYYGSNDLLNAFGFTASFHVPERAWNRDLLERVPIDRASTAYADEYEYYAAIYYKGTPTIAFLCGLMGKEKEKEFWQDWVGRYSNRMPTTDAFLTRVDEFLPEHRPGLAREIVHATSRLDLTVTEVKTKHSDSANITATDSTPRAPEYENTVRYVLQNHFDLPVALRLWLDDGSSTDTTLMATTGAHRLTLHGDKPLRAAMLDPEHIFTTDINYLNNSMTVDESSGPALRIFSGLTFLIQSLLSTVWGW